MTDRVGQKIGNYRLYGMLVMAASPSPIAATAVMCIHWPGHPMACASPPALMIRQCRCGEPYRRSVGGETVEARFSTAACSRSS
jgi:hypothetical protein